MKNEVEFKNNWYEVKKNLKMKFAKLTDNDLLFEENQKTQMMKRVQQKLGLSEIEIQKIISDL